MIATRRMDSTVAREARGPIVMSTADQRKAAAVEDVIKAFGTIPNVQITPAKRVLGDLSVIQLDLVRSVFLEKESLADAAKFVECSLGKAKKEISVALLKLCSNHNKVATLCALVRQARILGY